MNNEQTKSPLVLERIAFEEFNYSRDVNTGSSPSE